MMAANGRSSSLRCSLQLVLIVLIFFTAKARSQYIGGVLGIGLNTTTNNTDHCTGLEESYNSTEVQSLLHQIFAFNGSAVSVNDIISCTSSIVFINITLDDNTVACQVEGMRNASGSFNGYSVIFIEINTTCSPSSVISISSTFTYSNTLSLISSPTTHPLGSITTTAATPSSTATPNTVTFLSLFRLPIIVASAIFGVSCLLLSTCAIILAIIKKKMEGPSNKMSGNRIQGKTWKDDNYVLEDYQSKSKNTHVATSSTSPPPPAPPPAPPPPPPGPIQPSASASSSATLPTPAPPPPPPLPGEAGSRTLPTSSSQIGNTAYKPLPLHEQSAPPPPPPLPPLSDPIKDKKARPLPELSNKANPNKKAPPQPPNAPKPPMPLPVEDVYDEYNFEPPIIEDIYDFGPELDNSQDDLLNTEYINVKNPGVVPQYSDIDYKDDEGVNEYVDMASSGIFSPTGNITFGTNELYI